MKGREDRFGCATNAPPEYRVHVDNPPDHAVIFPVHEIDVVNAVPHKYTPGVAVGNFTGIQEMPWLFCCNVYEMKAKGIDTEYKD